jgi:hypothetical protein
MQIFILAQGVPDVHWEQYQGLRSQLAGLTEQYQGVLATVPPKDTASVLCWQGLLSDTQALAQALDSRPAMPSYKLQVLTGLLPYLKKLSDRQGSLFSKSTDKDRFAQIQRILYVLASPEAPDEHPSQVLFQLEEVSNEIRAKGYIFSSELQVGIPTKALLSPPAKRFIFPSCSRDRKALM